MKSRNRVYFLAAVVSVAALLINTSHAYGSLSVSLSEFLINAPSADQNQEFIEISSDTGGVESLAGLTFLVLDGTGSQSGVIDVVVDLGSFSTGTNGLFLFQDDDGAAPTFVPTPDPNTTFASGEFTNFDGSGDDMENGSATYLIVSGFTGAGGDDLDDDNDGALNAILPWTSVVDAVGWTEDDEGDEFSFAAALGGLEFDNKTLQLPGVAPDGFVRAPDGDFFIDILGAIPGPYTLEAGQVYDSTGAPVPGINPAFTMTPGSANAFNVVPEPAALGMLLLGVGVLVVRRRS